LPGAGPPGPLSGRYKIQERFIHFIEGISVPELPEVESFRKYFEATSLHDPVTGSRRKAPRSFGIKKVTRK
jgi:hypothetical protein